MPHYGHIVNDGVSLLQQFTFEFLNSNPEIANESEVTQPVSRSVSQSVSQS